MAPLATVEIDVVSDTVCPWCYVGKARMAKALARYAGSLEFRVRWFPFQLNPGASEAGVSKIQMYNEKFGPGRVAQMAPMMTRTFAEEGLPPYSMDGLTGNTLTSHRLLTWAAEEHGLEAQDRLADRLFQGYFTEARFINDRVFLVEAAAAAGLPAYEAAKVVDDPRAYLKQTAEELRRYPGITGVPHFVIRAAGSPQPVARLGGAQPPEDFSEVFDQILSSAKAAAGTAAKPAGADGAACGLGSKGVC